MLGLMVEVAKSTHSCLQLPGPRSFNKLPAGIRKVGAALGLTCERIRNGKHIYSRSDHLEHRTPLCKHFLNIKTEVSAWTCIRRNHKHSIQHTRIRKPTQNDASGALQIIL